VCVQCWNLLGDHVTLSQAMLKRRQGRILVISSMAGRIPSPGQALYSAAKFGLNGYFQALSTEICDRWGARRLDVRPERQVP
jgi:short-subunit dehydrogenase